MRSGPCEKSYSTKRKGMFCENVWRFCCFYRKSAFLSIHFSRDNWSDEKLQKQKCSFIFQLQ
ncbi:CLUMA_CG016301, isoform A [Clunio marinus]|uniref:CLUMA_CG016301, isoform A n=1 Tax=Clunio marinus TaxID=568069 RepID=A0A1J1IVY6_9DIPT|nr:CLUMA_CG016301, isoform A [Clunio marinus]